MITIKDTFQSLNKSGISVESLAKGVNTVGKNNLQNAPINAGNLSSITPKVIISENLTEKLAYIRSTISRQHGTGKIEELAFAMLGHKDEQGNVIIDDIAYDESEFEHRLANAQAGSLDTAEAHFGESLTEKISKHAQDKSIQKPVVIHGHTHPQNLNSSTNLTTNFSLADMNAYAQFQQNVKQANSNADSFGMVINEVGDFNVVHYDLENSNFEKSQSVYLGQDKLPSYTDGYYLDRINTEQANQQEIETPHEEIQSTPEPKIEKVSISEIANTGYYDNYVTPKQKEEPKKSLFGRLKEFAGIVFDALFHGDDILREAKAGGKSIANPNIGKKLEACKSLQSEREM